MENPFNCLLLEAAVSRANQSFVDSSEGEHGSPQDPRSVVLMLWVLAEVSGGQKKKLDKLKS